MHMLDKTIPLVQARTGARPNQLNQSLSQSPNWMAGILLS